MTCNPRTTSAAVPSFVQDHASWSNDVSTPQAGSRGIDRMHVVLTGVRSVDDYRATNVAALAKQGAPPPGEPR